jgi:hypothetical protein
MQINYFVFDTDHQLHRVPRELVEEFWNGRLGAQRLPCLVGDQLRLISVLVDDETLMPLLVFFLRTDVEQGEITDDSRFMAYEATVRHLRRRYDSDAARSQMMGWPSTWRRQLAVALDVVPDELRRIGIGGPLLMSDLWGISIERVLDYFEEVRDD